MRAGEAKDVAEIVDQQQPRLDLGLVRFSINSNLDFGWHGASRTNRAYELFKIERGRKLTPVGREIQGRFNCGGGPLSEEGVYQPYGRSSSLKRAFVREPPKVLRMAPRTVSDLG